MTDPRVKRIPGRTGADKPALSWIEPASPVPFHHQVKESLKRQVLSSELKPGDKLPSEFEIAETLGLSRNTVRQAILALVNEGLLYRKQGKGTFVSRERFRRGVPGLTGFNEYIRGLGQVPSSKVFLVEYTRAYTEVALRLQLPGDSLIVRVERQVCADGQPIGYHEIFLPPAVWEMIQLSPPDLNNQSFYNLIENNCRLALASADETIEVGYATPHVAKYLDVVPGSAVLLMSRLVYSHKDEPVCYAENVYRPDRYRYHLRYRRPTIDGSTRQILAVDNP